MNRSASVLSTSQVKARRVVFLSQYPHFLVIPLVGFRRLFESVVRRCAAQRCAFRLARGLILASLQAARHRTPREGVSPSSHWLELELEAAPLHVYTHGVGIIRTRARERARVSVKVREYEGARKCEGA
jgi:hypothetical protein